MISERAVRDAFNTFALAAMKVAKGSDKWVHFVAACQVLGWVLEEGAVYVDNTEKLLKVLREHVGNPVHSNPRGG